MFKINKSCTKCLKIAYLTEPHNIVDLQIITPRRPLFWCGKSSASMALLLSLTKSQYFYLEIILQDYDTADRAAGSAAMDMVISVTGSVHTWQCFLRVMLHTSNGGWSFLGILLSSYRKQETNLVWAGFARSVMHQIAALTYYSQIERDGVNHNSLFHSVQAFLPTGTVWLCVGPVFHTFTLSLS